MSGNFKATQFKFNGITIFYLLIDEIIGIRTTTHNISKQYIELIIQFRVRIHELIRIKVRKGYWIT